MPGTENFTKPMGSYLFKGINTMQKSKSVIWALMFVFLAGCVPNATVYYRPSVDVESTYEQGHCVPVDKYVFFNIKAKSQTLKVRGYGSTYTGAQGELVSEGQYVIFGNWNEIKYKNEDFYITGSDADGKVKAQKLYGEVNVSHSDSNSMFNSSAVFPKQDGNSFDVYFPPLIIDGEEIDLPVLHIEKTIWMGMSPFNC